MKDIVFDRHVSDNPFVDEIMYYTRTMAYNCIIKNANKADSLETSESSLNGKLYTLCIEGKISIDALYSMITKDIFTPILKTDKNPPKYGIPIEIATSKYSDVPGDLLGFKQISYYKTMVVEINGQPVRDPKTGLAKTEEVLVHENIYEYADKYYNSPKELPGQIKEYLLPLLKRKFVEEYEEVNPYYRMLNGIPNIGDEGIDIRPYLRSKKVPDNIVNKLGGLGTPVYMHTLSTKQLSYISGYNILAELKEKYPEALYLNYLGEKRIPIYNARTAANFQLLYLPQITELKEIRERFKDRYQINRNVVLKTIYSTAMKYGSDYYDEFMMMYIVLHTIIDILCRIQEIIGKREMFDERCIKYIFSMYQVPYYEEIPVKYQLRIMKNIHNLLKYKSTEKNLKDICDLFDRKDIIIYRYYLLRRRQIDEEGDYLLGYNDDYGRWEENSEDFLLDFVKVPLGDEADGYMRDETNYLDYEDVVSGDNFWDGTLDHNRVKKDHKLMSYSFKKSKYISIDSINDIAKSSFQASFFNGILFDNRNLDFTYNSSLDLPMVMPDTEDDILITVYSISQNPYPLAQWIVMMYDLAFTYYNIESTIQTNITGILYILGFNFDNIIHMYDTIRKDLLFKGYDITKMLDPGLGSSISTDKVQITDQVDVEAEYLVNLFNGNMEIVKLILREMYNALDYNTYKAYVTVYDAFLISKYNRDFFSATWGDDGLDTDGPITERHEVYDTMTEYLMNMNQDMYNEVKLVKEIKDNQIKIQRINYLITEISTAISNAINDEDLMNSIYTNLPSVSTEFVIQYMMKIIEFFKSFRLQIHSTNSILHFGGDEYGKTTSYMKFYEVSKPEIYTVKREQYDMNDRIRRMNLTKTEKDSYKMIDKVQIMETYN